jgi:phosphoribosylaminoimidazolecarboxamide formyltransferase/IMP cyclohydrolase
VRRGLAVKAFRHTQAYDAAIAAWLGGHASPEGERFPRHLTLDLVRELELRYGENPHQQATLYRLLGGEAPLGGMRQLQGKELSYNNLLDADAARKLVGLFAEPAVAIVKHTNPCGVGRGGDPAEAFSRALATDPVSSFGSIVAVNRPVDRAFAETLGELFVEVLVAPAFDEGALAAFAAKRALRLLAAEPYRPEPGALELRAVDGGLLAQDPDGLPDSASAWSCATRREPSAGERRALEFAWGVVRYAKSNAIVLATADQTVGIGAGQMSRVDSCRLAVEKSLLPVAGAAAASDAFFPFRDGIDALAAAGVTAVVQPGGSRRDEEVITAADEHGMAMLLTGTRHFRH